MTEAWEWSAAARSRAAETVEQVRSDRECRRIESEHLAACKSLGVNEGGGALIPPSGNEAKLGRSA
jgi:hypothetical protein